MNTPEPTPDTAPDTGSPRLARTAAVGRVHPWAALDRGAAPVTGTAPALAAEVLRLRALLGQARSYLQHDYFLRCTTQQCRCGMAAFYQQIDALLDSDDLLPSSHSYRLADDDAPTGGPGPGPGAEG